MATSAVSYSYHTPTVYQLTYEAQRKDEFVGATLALFLGTFGAHHFYMGRNALGILYLIFFWTGIPTLLGFIECFLMPGRVRLWNAMLAAHLGLAGQGSVYNTYVQFQATPASNQAVVTCSRCGRGVAAAANFCPNCGASLARPAALTKVQP